MADQLQLRRGTTAENLAFTGAQGEVTIDTDKNAIVIHDGVTAGGYPQASEAALNNFTTFFDDDVAGGSTADAYLLAAKDDSLLPNEYNDGQYLGFVTTNTNTGPSTANFIGLGQKNIKYADGTDPEPGDINGRVTMIYDADNDWLELQRKFQAAQVQTKASVRQTVYTGPVDANGRADFIDAGTGLQAVTAGLASNALILSFGKGFDGFGASDLVVSVGSNQTFGGLTDNDVNYLYLEYDEDAETITAGSTILDPEYSQAKPTSPTSGQYWYPIDHRSRGEVWDGADWQPVLRVFVGDVTTATGSVTSTNSYQFGSGSWVESPVGQGQKWMDFTSGRSAGVTYTNTTGRPLFVSVRATTDSLDFIQIIVDGFVIARVSSEAAAAEIVAISAFVPAGSQYSVTTDAALIAWLEMK